MHSKQTPRIKKNTKCKTHRNGTTEQMCWYLQRQPLLLILVLLKVLALTSMVRAPALVSQLKRSSTPACHCLRNSKSRSRKSLLLRIGCPAWIHISRDHFKIFLPDLKRWNRISAPSLHDCPGSRHLQPQHRTYPIRCDPGLQSNKLTAPQPPNHMAQHHQPRKWTTPWSRFTTIPLPLRTIPQRDYEVDR